MDYNKYKNRLLSNCYSADNGCIVWLGPIKGIGYGYLTIGSRIDGSRKTITAHRLSYLIHKGETNGLCVLHKCDNPGCVNPEHLFLGTRIDNNKDRELKGRGVYFSGEDNGRAIITNEIAEQIRNDYSTGKHTHRSLARKYNFKDHTSIGDIISKKSYLPDPPKI